jgi:hypothetical protein
MTLDELHGSLIRAKKDNPHGFSSGRCLIDLEEFMDTTPHGFEVSDWGVVDNDTEYYDLTGEVEEWLNDNAGRSGWADSILDESVSVVGFKDISDAIHFYLRWNPLGN